MKIDINTTSTYPTHFLRGIELIKKARGDFKVASENWPSPTESHFGIPNDRYYAEIWVDGMDWQNSYWIIEQYNFKEPQINPLIIFNNHNDENKFKCWDFSELKKAIIYYRRDFLWINKNDLYHYTDSVWPYLKLVNDELKYKKCKLYSFEHASQPKVEFWINEEYIPEKYRGKKINGQRVHTLNNKKRSKNSNF